MSHSPGKKLARHLPNLIWEWRGARPAGERGFSGGIDPVLSDAELKSVAASLLRLQRGLTGERTLVGEPYMEDRGLLGAYLLYYWPVSYLQTAMALDELDGPAKDSPASFRRILDIGSGPGPSSHAFLDRGATDFTLIDSGGKALAHAKALLQRASDSGATSPARTPEIPSDPVQFIAIRADIETLEEFPPGPFDAIVLSHTMNELWRSEASRAAKRLDFLGKLVSLLSENGILLIVEPAITSTSRELLGLRDTLLAAHPELGVAGPCPESRPCPALASGPNRSCHSEYAWAPPEPIASLAQAAGLDRSSIKACWMAFQKNPSRDGSVRPGAQDSSTRTSPPDATSLSGRIVSEPMLNKAGRIRYIVCAGSRLVTVSASADDAHAREAGFMDLRRGDRVDLGGLEARGGDASGAGRKMSASPAETGPGADPAGNFGFAAGSVLRRRVAVRTPES